VVIAAAQPAILSPNGAAYIDVYAADGTALPVNSAVTAGDVITLYCSGLGAVTPPVTAGSPAPSSTLSKTVNPVTAMIGQTPAVVQFAGLAPGWVELYQVNVTIPSGLPSGKALLTLSVSGQQSAPVSITVK
jgi:minor extracellular serine protease Vpr